MSRSLCAALTLALIGAAGCTDYSPWPPDGTQKGAKAEERKARGLPEAKGEGAPKSLLAQALEEPGVPTGPALDTMSLPRQSKAVVYAAMQAAAKDDLDGLLHLVAPSATWGLPVTSQLQSTAIEDDPELFIDVMRDVASRMSAQAAFRCAPIMPPALETYVTSGAEPMWCSFTSNDRHDILLFKLRTTQSRAQIEYVGMFVDKPTGPVRVASAEPPPPAVAPGDRTATNDDYTFKSYEPAPQAGPGKSGKTPPNPAK